MVVGSGWWSTGERSPWNIGTDLIRSTSFFALWHRQVLKCLDPARIVVVDSHAPNKPAWPEFERVHWIELDRNYGHANDLHHGRIVTKHCGFTRSMILSATYALCCDADVFVYVEQDCLVHGENFLQAAIGAQELDFYCGQRCQGGISPKGNPALPMYQNSIVVMNRSGLERYITMLVGSPESDVVMSPEDRIEKYMAPFGTLRVPYGRSRPIDFSLPHFYAQHMSQEELVRFLDLESLGFSDWFAAA